MHTDLEDNFRGGRGGGAGLEEGTGVEWLSIRKNW